MSAILETKPTLQAYLDWENQQPERHEFHRGEVFAMVGARRVHGCVVNNLSGELRMQLKGTPCRVFTEGMKVQPAADTILYPDVFVTCDKADLATEMIFRAPKLVIEVLSPSTQGYNRGLKFALYRQMASLEEYILVDPDTRRVEGFRRNAERQWVLHDMSEDDALVAASVGCRITKQELFDGLDADAASGADEQAGA